MVRVAALEQMRVVGLAIRRETLLLCGAMVAFATVGPYLEEFSTPQNPLIVDPSDLGYLAILVALVAPIGVWKGERFFGESPLWMAPVDQALHARLKIFSGWVWLMAVIAFGYAVIVVTILAVGGSIGADETRLLATDVAAARAGATEVLVPTAWSTQLWQWTLPFTAATPVYLAASAFLVGLRRPVIWGAGIWIGLITLGEFSDSERLPMVAWVINGLVYLFDMLGTGGTQTAQISVPVAPGEWTRAWAGLPTAGPWVSATVGWLALAILAVWAATRRSREA